MASDASSPRPNIVFILTDDHAAHAISAYSGRINSTPHLDRIAQEGARLDALYCTNSICTRTRKLIHFYGDGLGAPGASDAVREG